MQARVCKRVVELSRAPCHHQCMGSELEVEHSRINCVQTALAERTRDRGEIRKKAGPPHDFREFVSIRAAMCARVRVCVCVCVRLCVCACVYMCVWALEVYGLSRVKHVVKDVIPPGRPEGPNVVRIRGH